MPVGLNFLETVESKLLEDGLLPRDSTALHRIIDFARGEFTLRWSSHESDYHLISIHLMQQLALRSSDRPMIAWSVMVDESEDWMKRGRALLTAANRPTAMAAEVADACAALLAVIRTEQAGASSQNSSEGEELPQEETAD